jgi:hypothetical protein
LRSVDIGQRDGEQIGKVARASNNSHPGAGRLQKLVFAQRPISTTEGA